MCDGGKEFAAHFAEQATKHGVVTYKTGTKAPWQNGKTERHGAHYRTERHGAHYKTLLEKARAEWSSAMKRR